MWYVYLLLCKDNSLYTGITDNLKRRFAEHQEGKGGRYTRSHKPIKIIYSEKLANKSKALKREMQIKSWERAAKIRTLGLINL